MVNFTSTCDRKSFIRINTLLQNERFLHVRNMIISSTPFGGFLKLKLEGNHSPPFICSNIVNSWNGKKLVIRNREFQIDEELVTRFVSFPAGNEIIEPRSRCPDPDFLKEPIPNCKQDNRKFHKQLISMFTDKNAVIMEASEVIQLTKAYVLLLFSALLFSKRNHVPREYFYLLEDENFKKLKSYKFDLEVAKHLENGIQEAKESPAQRVYVNGFLHIIERLFVQERVFLIQNMHKQRENAEDGNAASVKKRKKRKACNAPADNLKATLEEPLKLGKVADKKERQKKKMRKANADDSVSEKLRATGEEGLGLNEEDGEMEENDYTLSGINSTIDHMQSTLFRDLNPELIAVWEEYITNAEKSGSNDFDFSRVRNLLGRVKEDFFNLMKIDAKMQVQDSREEEKYKEVVAAKKAFVAGEKAFVAGKKAFVAAKKALKEAEDAHAVDKAISHTLIKEWKKAYVAGKKAFAAGKKAFAAVKKALKEAEDAHAAEEAISHTLIKEWKEYPLYGKDTLYPLSKWC